jgi:hypothetical protein
VSQFVGEIMADGIIFARIIVAIAVTIFALATMAAAHGPTGPVAPSTVSAAADR